MSAIFSKPFQITVTTPYPSNITLSISPNSGYESTTFTASGQVTDQNGNPISGVTVYLWSFICEEHTHNAQWHLLQNDSGTTDSTGYYSITFTGSEVLSAMGLAGSESPLGVFIEASNQNSWEPSNPSCRGER